MPSTEFTSWIEYYAMLDKAKADALPPDGDDARGL